MRVREALSFQVHFGRSARSAMHSTSLRQEGAKRFTPSFLLNHPLCQSWRSRCLQDLDPSNGPLRAPFSRPYRARGRSRAELVPYRKKFNTRQKTRHIAFRSFCPHSVCLAAVKGVSPIVSGIIRVRVRVRVKSSFLCFIPDLTLTDTFH